MNYLKDLIREKKILEMDEDIEKFFEANDDLSDQAIIYKVVLDKERFKTEEEAREYLKSKWFWDYSIDEEDNSFVAISDLDEIVTITDKKFDIGRGAIGFVANIIPSTESSSDVIIFNEKGEVNLSTKFDTINLNSGLPHIIEIARVAEGEHPSYGKLNITQEILEQFVINFKSNVTGVDLAVNEDHKKNEAFGWFKDVFLSFDKQTLLGQVNWNSKGTTALSEKEYRYFSPEFRFNYKHPHTGMEHGPTLLGGALTNYPFLKMEAITELNNKQTKEGIVSKENTTIDLSVHNEKIVELSGKITEVTSKLDASEARNVELSEKVKELNSTIELSEKKTAHEKLFTAGTINKAQLDAMNEGKGMLEVLALSEKMNTKGKGSDEAPKGGDVELSEKELEVAKSLNLTAEEYNAVN